MTIVFSDTDSDAAARDALEKWSSPERKYRTLRDIGGCDVELTEWPLRVSAYANSLPRAVASAFVELIEHRKERMIALDDKHLMMIEPKEPATEPIRDELTLKALAVLDLAEFTNIAYKGFHTCVCGKHSDNRDWILPEGVVTNSLLVHYVECHREEIPERELMKLELMYHVHWAGI